MEPRLHGADTGACAARHFIEREVGPEVQDQDDALSRRKRRDRSRDLVAAKHGREGIGRMGALVERDEADAAPPPKPVPASIDDDAVEPSGEARGVAQVAGMSERGLNRVADGVFSLPRVPKDQSGQPIHTVEIASDEIREALRSTIISLVQTSETAERFSTGVATSRPADP